MITEPVEHFLCATLRFVDAFTLRPVSVPLDVRAESLPVASGMPRLPWKATPGRDDGTYRLLVTNRTVAPVGSIHVNVTAPGGEYASFDSIEPLAIGLPLPLASPPTPTRSDFLVERPVPWPSDVVPLWPTRAAKIQPRETAVVGSVANASGPVPDLRVKLGLSPGPLPMIPYTYTDAAGEFVFRLPALKTVSGGVPITTASLLIELRVPPAYSSVVSPTSPVFPLTVDLGKVSVLNITVP